MNSSVITKYVSVAFFISKQVGTNEELYSNMEARKSKASPCNTNREQGRKVLGPMKIRIAQVNKPRGARIEVLEQFRIQLFTREGRGSELHTAISN